MTERNTGGPAFPGYHFEYADNEHGMSLRDYFAIHASDEDIKQMIHRVGLLEQVLTDGASGRKSIVQMPNPRARQVARYMVADAMLEARK